MGFEMDWMIVIAAVCACQVVALGGAWFLLSLMLRLVAAGATTRIE